MSFCRNIAAIAAALVMLLAAGCQGQMAQRTSDKDLGTVELHPFPVGATWHGLRNGKGHTVVLVSRSGDEATFEDSRGCIRIGKADYFSPPTKFVNCGSGTGTQTITDTEGSIWPLQLGKTQSWSYEGRNEAGRTWSTKRRCEVESVEHVRVPAGEFDTYKVVCENPGRRTRTWYYSPDAKSPVLLIRMRRDVLFATWQLVSGPAS